MKSFIKKLLHKISLIIAIQSLATLTSIPFLSFAGLNFSSMSLIGNIIFYPVLVIFLFLSSLIFLTEILFLKNHSLIQAFNILCSQWLKVLSLGSKQWNFFVSHREALILVFLISLWFFIAKKRLKLSNRTFLIVSFIIFHTLSCQYVKKTILQLSPNQEVVLKKGYKKLILFNDDEKIYMQDDGYISSFKNPQSLINFTVLPTIAKTFGYKKIEKITLKQSPGKRATEFIDSLQEETSVNQIEIKKKSFQTAIK